MGHHFIIEIVPNQLPENLLKLWYREYLQSFYSLWQQFEQDIRSVHTENRFQVSSVDIFFHVPFYNFHHDIKDFNFLFVSVNNFCQYFSALIAAIHERKRLINYVGFRVFGSIVFTLLFLSQFAWLQKLFWRFWDHKLLILNLLLLIFRGNTCLRSILRFLIFVAKWILKLRIFIKRRNRIIEHWIGPWISLRTIKARKMLEI